MTKQEILDYFKDINYAYNDCGRLESLSYMLDKLMPDPVEPEVRQHTYWCGKCGNHLKVIGLNIKDNYCGKCGTPVLWKGDENK